MVIPTFANLHGILALCCTVEKCEDNLLTSADEKYEISIVDISFQCPTDFHSSKSNSKSRL